MSKKKSIVVLAIKPKYAEAIYSGKKRWEFRKAPPPVPGWVYLYESAPVSKITGCVYLAFKVQGQPDDVWDVTKCQHLIPGSAGISWTEFRAYVGKAKSVAACATFSAERYPEPIALDSGFRPPQNWGRYVFVEKTAEGAQ